ncbi:MAG: tyrosine-type recombinase/integrase [Candidatus Aenigmatarchaeota archaeon]
MRSTTNETLLRYQQERRINGISENRRRLDMTVLVRLDEFLGKDFENTKEEDIKAFFELLDIKQSTKNQYISILKKFFSWLGKPEATDWLKLGKIKTTILKSDLPTVDILNKMISRADNSRDKCLVALNFDTGGRISEVLNIRLLDIHLENECIEIDIRVSKTDMRSVVCFDSMPYLKAHLKEHKFRDNMDSYLFCRSNNPNKHICKEMAHKIITYYSELVCGRKFSPKMFRHLKASLLSSQLSDSHMKKYFGWCMDSKMLARYVHLSSDDVINQLKQQQGLITTPQDRNPIMPRTCSECQALNPRHLEYCQKCGYGLTTGAIEKSSRIKKLEKMEGFLHKICTTLAVTDDHALLNADQKRFNKDLVKKAQEELMLN